MAETTLNIKGMHCASCVTRVEKSLKQVEGVSDARVNLATNEAAVTLNDAGADVAQLIKAVERAGYGAALPQEHEHGEHAQHAHDHGDQNAWRWRVIVGIILTTPLMIISMAWHQPASLWLQLALALPVQFILGWPFYVGAFKSIKRLSPDMDTLVALGSTVAFAYSVYQLVVWLSGTHAGDSSHVPHVYFETAAMILTLIGVGKMLESRARSSAASAIRELMQLQPARAFVVRDGQEREIPVGEIQVGDRIIVKPGSRVPVDGAIEEGNSSVDQSMLTGESMPVDVSPGSIVTGGTLNQTGSFTFRATQIGKHTTLAQIVDLVKKAQGSKANVQRIADKVAGWFVQAVMVISLVTLLVWGLALNDWDGGIFAAIAVLIVACPCAMGLAVPAAIMVGTGLGARMGILIKDAAALERAGKLTHIILDKTGTLTRGQPAVTEVREHHPDRVVLRASDNKDAPAAAAGERGRDAADAAEATGDRALTAPPYRDGATARIGALFALAAAVETRSEHPLGAAIVREARARQLTLSEVTDFQSITAGGVRGRVSGKAIIVGKLATLGEHDISIDDRAKQASEEMQQAGSTVVAVAIDGSLAGFIAMSDQLKEGAAEAVKQLHDLGLKTTLMTGDQKPIADAVAKEIGIDDVLAEVLPKDKAAKVEAIQKQGGIVAMVGDGINDAPALAAANIGIAMGGARKESGDRRQGTGNTVAAGLGPSGPTSDDAHVHHAAHAGQGRSLSLSVLNPEPGTRNSQPAPGGSAGSDIAMQAGHVVLVGGDLASLPRAIRLSRAIMKRIHVGLFWAFIYNIALIPLAAVGWLDPMLAAGAMAFSSISVVLNALWLKWTWK
ncbi:MAG: heavy metal translocating P-type ATPase [Phycisphaeraceae bacterium]